MDLLVRQSSMVLKRPAPRYMQRFPRLLQEIYMKDRWAKRVLRNNYVPYLQPISPAKQDRSSQVFLLLGWTSHSPVRIERGNFFPYGSSIYLITLSCTTRRGKTRKGVISRRGFLSESAQSFHFRIKLCGLSHILYVTYCIIPDLTYAKYSITMIRIRFQLVMTLATHLFRSFLSPRRLLLQKIGNRYRRNVCIVSKAVYE